MLHYVMQLYIPNHLLPRLSTPDDGSSLLGELLEICEAVPDADAVHFPHILASGKSRAAMSGKCTFFSSRGTRFSAHFPRIATGRRTFPPYPCIKIFGCSDMREMNPFPQVPLPGVQE